MTQVADNNAVEVVDEKKQRQARSRARIEHLVTLASKVFREDIEQNNRNSRDGTVYIYSGSLVVKPHSNKPVDFEK
jgi:hypothetical protein